MFFSIKSVLSVSVILDGLKKKWFGFLKREK